MDESLQQEAGFSAELNRTFSDHAAPLRSVAEREQCGSNRIVAAGEFNPPACADSVILIAISPL